MEPQADFSALISRLELTNVDVAQLRDIGWSTVAVPEASAFLCCGLICGALAACRLVWRNSGTHIRHVIRQDEYALGCSN
jgi:hypothetical protein